MEASVLEFIFQGSLRKQRIKYQENETIIC